MADHLITGERGEELARRYLAERGMTIVASNWRAGRAEIDIIARSGDRLIFVEVKTRRRATFLAPEAAVNRRKARRLAAAASAYMAKVGHEGEIRFDVIAVILPVDGQPTLRHIKDAFFF